MALLVATIDVGSLLGYAAICRALALTEAGHTYYETSKQLRGKTDGLVEDGIKSAVVSVSSKVSISLF